MSGPFSSLSSRTLNALSRSLRAGQDQSQSSTGSMASDLDGQLTDEDNPQGDGYLQPYDFSRVNGLGTGVRSYKSVDFDGVFFKRARGTNSSVHSSLPSLHSHFSKRIENDYRQGSLDKVDMVDDKNFIEHPGFHWTHWHTFLSIVTKLFILIIGKSAYYFDSFYASGLGISLQQYTYILVAQEIGNVLSTVISIYTNEMKSNRIQFVFLILLSFSTLAFVIPYGKLIGPLWISVAILVSLRFIFGAGAGVWRSNIIGVAGSYSHPSKRGTIISCLEIAFVVATLTFIGLGYLISEVGWWFILVVCGILYIPLAFIMYWAYPDHSIPDYDRFLKEHQLRAAKAHANGDPLAASSDPGSSQLYGDETSDDEDLFASNHDLNGSGMVRRRINNLGPAAASTSVHGSTMTGQTSTTSPRFANDFKKRNTICGTLPLLWSDERCRWLYLGFFFGTICNGILSVTLAPWLVTNYGFTSKGIGYVTLIMGFAEIIGCIINIKLMDRIGTPYFTLLTSFGWFVTPLCACALAVLGYVYDGGNHDFLGMYGSLTIIGLMYFFWEMLFAVGATMAVELSPKIGLRNVNVALWYSTLAIARALGGVCAPIIWESYGILGASVAWTCLSFLAFACFYRLKVRRAQLFAVVRNRALYGNPNEGWQLSFNFGNNPVDF